MKRTSVLMAILLACALGGGLAAPARAFEAYFDSEISTDLEVKPNTGTVVIKMLDEQLPQVFQDVNYERRIFVEIIFDASSTMREPDLNGVAKIDIARKLVELLVNYFPQQDTFFALRLNGAVSPNNCFDSELVVPFSRSNGALILDAVKNIQPLGLSPISYALRQMLADFKNTTGTKIVFVVTDGQETCDIEPVDTCTVTMDLITQAEFDGSINILGVNTLHDDVQNLMTCLAVRGNGEFLDSNRNSGRQLGQLIQSSSQVMYSISRILDSATLSEGKILELYNRRIGDVSIIDGDQLKITERNKASSKHELEPGIYKIDFATVPALSHYFTVDQKQELTLALIRTDTGLDLYDRAHLAIANEYYDQGQIDKAIAEYEKILAFDAQNIDVHLNLGIIYQDILGDNEKAAEHYKTYLELQGLRQQEVGSWLREVRGLPSPEEELEQKLKEREAQKAKEEAEQQALKEEAQRRKARENAIQVHREIVTANPNIRELSEEAVISREVLEVTVSEATTDSKAEKIALDVGKRMLILPNRTPEIVVYRENRPDVVIIRAHYEAAQGAYVATAP